MRPYYSDDHCTIYHADWRDVEADFAASQRAGIDLVLTDPPYGVKLKTLYKDAKRGVLAGANNYAPIAGDNKPFDPSPFLLYPAAVLWGANYYADKLPPRGSWLVWDKRDGSGYNDQADAELAWVSGVTGTVPRLFRHRWNGMIKASEQDQRRVHPSQKPVELMSWCLNFFPNATSVFDPFMGSGPVARACADRQIGYVGCELVEEYCEHAVTRLAQTSLFG